MPSAISTANDRSLAYRLALPAGFMLGEYRIVEVLGQGGFGITYLCEDTRLNVQVAIKELLPVEFVTRSNDATVVLVTRSAKAGFEWAKQRFIAEAQILSRLSHPNVVRAFRLLEMNETAYLVMEYVRGSSLRDWVRTNPHPSEAQLTQIFLSLLDGLEYIHREGLLHRDISPDNIMIRDSGSPLLLDFGSARTVLSTNRNFTNVVRHGFSPIEQYQSMAPQGCYTDIYALAGTIFYALTGLIPASAIDRFGDRDPFPSLAKNMGDSYSHGLLKAIDWGFAVKPEARPQNAADWRRFLITRSKPTKNQWLKARVSRGPYWSMRLAVVSFAAGLLVATVLSSLLSHPGVSLPTQLTAIAQLCSTPTTTNLER
jgi:serine/threonine protein kinase